MVNDWKAYFIFSNKERKGIIVLGCILTASIVGSFIFPHPKESRELVLKNSVSISKLFKFDPNSIDSATAALLGIPSRQIKTLLHYREKGGRFYKKEDILKLYGLQREIANRLMPFIEIGKNKDYPKNERFHAGYEKYKVSLWQIDINNASENEWHIKTKLNKGTIHQIINYKNYLGGFKSIYQINKVYGFSDSIFQLLKPHLVVDKNWQIVLNSYSMNFSQWKSLGIFDNRQIAVLLKMRKENGGVLHWKTVVIKFDLTQEQGFLLKKKVIIND